MNDWIATTGITAPSLTTITLEFADFSTEDAATALANFLDTAAYVVYLYLENQALTRPVTVTVTLLPETSLSADESYITISDALTASEIIKLYSKREATISVALSTDLYQIMSFKFIGSLLLNDVEVLGDYNYDKIYTCETMTADII